MTDQPAASRPAYKPIVDCEICTRIPQKAEEDIEDHYRQSVPPEVDRLSTVVRLEDESTHRYCSSTTKLLQCPVCGTYYYHNHYDDDGEYFMDPSSDTITVRRYDPVTALDFLERVVGGGPNALPKALGQLTKAFAEGSTPPPTQIVADGLDAQQRAAWAEVQALRSRYPALMDELLDLLERGVPDWHIKIYAVEAACHHFLLQDNWEALRVRLLQHPDPVVRLYTARHVIGIGTGDAPVMDILHVTRPLRDVLEREMANKARMREIAGVLLELALADHSATLVYSHGFGASRYAEADTRTEALYGLVVAAGHKADLNPAVPALVGLLGNKPHLNSHVCWVLRTLAEKRKKSAQAIRDELDRLGRSKKRSVLNDENVKKLLETCEQRLQPKKRGGKTAA